MGRTRILMGFLIIAVMVSWIITFFFYSNLPLKIPSHFGFDGDSTLGDRWTFFIYPGVSTGIALLILAFYPLRRLFHFFGKGRIKHLPREFSEPAYQRNYQLALMAGIFAVMILTFIQSNVALIATGRATSFNVTPIYGAMAIFVLYILYSVYSLWQMTKAIEAYYKEWKEKGGEEE